MFFLLCYNISMANSDVITLGNLNTFKTKADDTYQGKNSNLTSISSLSTSATGYVKMTNGVASLDTPSFTDTNYYPTAFSWTNGTTAGPTGSLTGAGMSAVSFGAIPAASDTQSGVVTTGTQTFAGSKTIDATARSSGSGIPLQLILDSADGVEAWNVTDTDIDTIVRFYLEGNPAQNADITIEIPAQTNGKLALTSDILVDDIKIDGTSIVSSKEANFSTINGDYNASTNKLATASDIPTIPTIPTITLNGSETTTPSFFAPTSGGNIGYVLKGNGSSAAPTFAQIAKVTSTAMPAQQMNTSNYHRSLKIGRLLICFGYIKTSTSANTTVSFNTTNGTFNSIPFVMTTDACTSDSQVNRCYAASITTSGFTLPHSTSSTTLGYTYIAIGYASQEN